MCVPLEVGQRHQQQGLRDLPDPASRRSPIPQKAKSNWERTPSNTHARWTSTTIELLLTPRTHLRNAFVIRHVPATASPYGLGACCPPCAATQPSLSICTYHMALLSDSPPLAARRGCYAILVRLPCIVLHFFGCEPSRAISCRQEGKERSTLLQKHQADSQCKCPRHMARQSI